MSLPFLDANVFLRYLTQDEPDHFRRSNDLMMRLIAGDVSAIASTSVILEVIFTLHRSYKLPRTEIVAAMSILLSASGIVVEQKPAVMEALHLFAEHSALSMADCFHVAWMRANGLTEIISFDRGFDRLPDIERIEP
ncbi:MAG: PIN domain-containing protein [Thermomicrobiales bacterium]|jgi:predicted nucleic acid-binding protein|nr:PIN domain-containing protein [Thermomicrobiales bacterium]